MVKWFQDLSKQIITEWVVDPFTIDDSSASIELHLHESLIDIWTDEEMKAHFRMMELSPSGLKSAAAHNIPTFGSIRGCCLLPFLCPTSWKGDSVLYSL